MLDEMLALATKADSANAVWNTGREYSQEKQRMSAVIGEAGLVFFSDIDRHIDGVLAATFDVEGTIDPVKLAKFVMQEYDEGRYTSGFYHLGEATIGGLREGLRSAAESIGTDGLRIPKPNEAPGVIDAALAELRGYPSDLTVFELYDEDDDFASALRTVIGGDFEYPDHSHQSVGDIVWRYAKANDVRSLVDAEVLGRSKGVVNIVDPDVKQTVAGKVLGTTSAHTVLSLGRSALVVRHADLTEIPAAGAEVTIDFKNGMGKVSTRGLSSEVSR